MNLIPFASILIPCVVGLYSCRIIGGNSPDMLDSWKTQCVRKYKSEGELRDTIDDWGYSELKIISCPDSVRAIFGEGFKLYLINNNLEINDEICEAYFPDLKSNLKLGPSTRFERPSHEILRLFRSSDVDGQNLYERLYEEARHHAYQLILVYGFSRKTFLDSRMMEIMSVFDQELPPMFVIPTMRFLDSEMLESEFLSIRYSYWEEQGLEIPEIAYSKLDSIRAKELSN